MTLNQPQPTCPDAYGCTGGQPFPSPAVPPVADNDNERQPVAPRYDSALPRGARAVIEPAERPVGRWGRRRAGTWRLRFLPRGRLAVDPLTGWTGGCDPLRHVELAFPSRETALAYCRRQGLPADVREPTPRARPGAVRPAAPAGPLRLCCWPTGPHPLCCGRYPLEDREKDDARTA